MQKDAIFLFVIINISLGLCVNITASSDLFSDLLESLMCNEGLSVGGTKCNSQTYGIQDWIYSFNDYFNDEIIDASITANSIIDRLNSAMDTRVSILTSMASKIETLCTDYHSSGDTSTDIFDSLHFAGNTDLEAKLPSDIEYDSVYGNDVSLTTTTFKVPNNVDHEDEIVQFDATISSLLTNHMISLHDEYCTTDDGTNVYCAMYFGMTSGVFRQFPGKENSRGTDNSYNSYDPRYRPWYVSAASGKKDVIVLLDISGSMNINDRLSFAKEAVVSVLNTLGSNSMVNIIAFSSSITLSCFGEELVPATPKNIELLTTFVNGLNAGGGTDFILGFQSVFDTLDSRHATYGMNCHSSILFLTDGQSEDPTDLINNRNGDINAVIFSYTFGDGADEQIPKKLSELTNGVYSHIDDGDSNLISAMSSYYLYYAHNRQNDDSQEDKIIFTSPYLDFDTNILMITMALPVYIDNTYFVGVVGSDIPLTFLTESIGDITIGRESYSFIIDEKGELIIHPLITDPNESTLLQYIPIYVNDVEPNEFDIAENMINRESGSKIIQSTIKQSAGNVEYEGYIYTSANLLYIYAPIGPKSLSIAIVIYSEQNINAPMVPSFGLINSPTNECSENISNITYSNFNQCLSPFNLFHRLDLMLDCNSEWITQAQIMDINEHSYSFWSNSPISIKYSSYYLQSGLYENIFKALNKKPLCSELQELHDYANRNGINSFNNLPFDGFRTEISDNVLISIYILPSIYEFWKQPFLAINSSFVAMYFASYIGIMISYPAHSFSANYNPLIRPWYQRSLSYPNLFTFTTPYKDATTNSLVITGSTVIFAPNSSYPFGVVAFDFEYDQFIIFYQNIFNNQINGCDFSNQIFCLLIDSSSFLVYYEGIENHINDDDISHKFLGDLEPTLFQSLLDNNIFIMDENINYIKDTTDITYHINSNNNFIYNQSFDKNGGWYSIKQIDQTNLYIIIIEDYVRTGSYPQHCPADSYCHNVYSPGCIMNTHEQCVSAQIDACTQFETNSNNIIISSQCGASINNQIDISRVQCLTSICPSQNENACYNDDSTKNMKINWVMYCIIFIFLQCL